MMSDPNKGKFGGLSERNGRRLSVEITERLKVEFRFDAMVESIDGSQLEGPVKFHIHPEKYARSVISITKIRDGRRAILESTDSRQQYTIGATVLDRNGQEVQLEYDLADPPKRFQVALSFPGEHRDFVLQVANALASQLARDRIFYDDWYEVELLGAGGDLKLQGMYKDADLVVPFFSQYYDKPWCSLEWETIRGILLERRQDDAVIPVHLDDTQIEGWSVVNFGIRLRGRGPQQIAELILRRLAMTNSSTTPPPAISPIPGTSAAPLQPAQSSGALAIWQEKLDYLRQQEAITSDAAQKFALKKQIEECKQKIAELGGGHSV